MEEQERRMHGSHATNSNQVVRLVNFMEHGTSSKDKKYIELAREKYPLFFTKHCFQRRKRKLSECLNDETSDKNKNNVEGSFISSQSNHSDEEKLHLVQTTTDGIIIEIFTEISPKEIPQLNEVRNIESCLSEDNTKDSGFHESASTSNKIDDIPQLQESALDSKYSEFHYSDDETSNDSEGSQWSGAGSVVDSDEDTDSNFDVLDEDLEVVRNMEDMEDAPPLPDVSRLGSFHQSKINFNSTPENLSNSDIVADNTLKDPDLTLKSQENDKTVTNDKSQNVNTTKEKEKLKEPNVFDQCAKENCEGVNAPDYDNIIVEKKKDGKRVRLNHYCIFCGKDQTHLKRHLKRKHKNRQEVIDMLRKSKSNPSSKIPMKTILHAGDYIYNINANINKGDVRVARAPTKIDRDASDYLPCTVCRKLILVESFTNHVQTCSGLKAAKSHDLIRMGRRMIPACHPSANDLVRFQILPCIRRDSVYLTIRYDELLIEYGNEITCSLRGPQHKPNIITQLRRLGKLKLIMISSTQGIKYLSDCLVPENSSSIISAIEKMSNNGDPVTEFMLHPTVAQNVFTLVTKVTNTFIIMCIKKNNAAIAKLTEDFLRCIQNDYKKRLSRVAAESHGHARRHRSVTMPCPGDINTFLKYVSNNMVHYYNSLLDKFSEQSYFKLMKFTLCSLQVYNRRRPGDVERILLDDWRCLKKIDHSVRSYEKLNEGLQDLSKEYGLLTTRGKLGRDVQLLVSPQVQLCIELLLKNRQTLDIPANNHYIFGLPKAPLNVVRHLSAYISLRKLVVESGIENPQNFTATKLRKQLATACIRLNLNDAELNDLARYMGHHRDIHISTYRQNIVERDIPTFINFINTALAVPAGSFEENDPLLEDSAVNDTSAESPRDQPEDEPENPVRGSSNYNKNRSSNTERRNIPWRNEEIKIVLSLFSDYVNKKGKAPTTKSIREMLSKHPNIFKNRNEQSVRTWLYIRRKNSN